MRVRVEKWLAGLAREGRPDELEAKRLLADLGVAVPRGLRLGPTDDPGRVPFPGPYVAKLCGAGVAHKTEVGGVRLGLTSETLAEAVGALRDAAPGYSVLIEEEIRGDHGIELIVGGLVDPAFGPAVMVGIGGVLTELFQDAVFRLAPCSEAEAHRMLEELRVAPLFHGYRGLALDAGGLASVIHRISDLVLALGDRFRELDVNPLVFAKGRWVALDATIRLAPGG
jgi:acetyl-CoA synthetase (ADP-forming)